MGFVTCGRHGVRCCWHCDRCPKCEGNTFRLGRGDYCPDCVKKFKAEGYVWSEYYKDYTTPERAAKAKGQLTLI